MKKTDMIHSIVKKLELSEDERFEVAIGLTRLSRDKLVLMQRGMSNPLDSQKRLVDAPNPG